MNLLSKNYLTKHTIFLNLTIILSFLLLISCGNEKSPVQDNEPVTPPSNEILADAGPDTTIFAGNILFLDLKKCMPFNTRDYPYIHLAGDPSNPKDVYLRTDYPEYFLGFIIPGIYKYFLTVEKDEKISEPDTLNITVLPRENPLIKDVHFEYSIRMSNNYYTGEMNKSYLEKIEQIYIEYETEIIETLDGIEYCKNLKYFAVHCKTINDISHLALVSSLDFLQLSPINSFSDLEPVKSLYNLKFLLTGGPKDGDYSPVEELNGLVHLSLGNISTGQPFKKLVNLEYFRAKDIFDGDLSFARNMSKMKSFIVYMSNNEIEDITPLMNMTNLEELQLRTNKISNIDVLKNCKKLRTLYLGANKIHDISALENLTNLKTVDLSRNKITNIKPLIDNTDIQETRIIYLDNNPLDSLSVNTYIPLLKERGDHVEY